VMLPVSATIGRRVQRIGRIASLGLFPNSGFQYSKHLCW